MFIKSPISKVSEKKRKKKEGNLDDSERCNKPMFSAADVSTNFAPSSAANSSPLCLVTSLRSERSHLLPTIHNAGGRGRGREGGREGGRKSRGRQIDFKNNNIIISIPIFSSTFPSSSD